MVGDHVDASEVIAKEYEARTGYGVGDWVRLGRTAFAPSGTEGIIVGVELDLRDNERGLPASDPCFRVRLNTGSIVYVTPDQIARSGALSRLSRPGRAARDPGSAHRR